MGHVQKVKILSDDFTHTAASALKNGHLVAFPTETVYGLGGDAQNPNSISEIYRVKARPTNNPLIVHISSIQYLDEWAQNVPSYARKLATQLWPGPITLVFNKTKLAKDFITGNQSSVALRIPSNNVALEILREFEKLGSSGVAAPSANRYGTLSPTDANSVFTFLGQFLNEFDLIIDGGACQEGIESTIVDCTSEIPRILRPGPVSKVMIEEIGGVEVDKSFKKNLIKVPGQSSAHYAPKAKLYLTGRPNSGDGFLALESIPTPPGAIRIGSPKSSKEFAQTLYRSLFRADKEGIKKVYVVPSTGDELSIAILDRLKKAAQ